MNNLIVLSLMFFGSNAECQDHLAKELIHNTPASSTISGVTANSAIVSVSGAHVVLHCDDITYTVNLVGGQDCTDNL